MERAVRVDVGLKRDQIGRPVALEPVITCAPHYLQKPALGVTLAIAVEITERPQTRLLCGVGVIARQPPCERISGIEVGQHHCLEPAPPAPLRDPRHALFYPATHKTAANPRLFRRLRPDRLRSTEDCNR